MSQFRKTSCLHCGGHIEFDVDNDGEIVPCPHCGKPIELKIWPRASAQKAKSMPGGNAVICTVCASQNSKWIYSSSDVLDVGLWIFGIVAGLLFAIFFLLLPFALVHTVWRATTKRLACAMCNSDRVIPINSPVGRKIWIEHYGG